MALWMLQLHESQQEIYTNKRFQVTVKTRFNLIHVIERHMNNTVNKLLSNENPNKLHLPSYHASISMCSVLNDLSSYFMTNNTGRWKRNFTLDHMQIRVAYSTSCKEKNETRWIFTSMKSLIILQLYVICSSRYIDISMKVVKGSAQGLADPISKKSQRGKCSNTQSVHWCHLSADGVDIFGIISGKHGVAIERQPPTRSIAFPP